MRAFKAKHSLAILPLLLVSTCAHMGPASVAGECAAFQNPGFAVQGKRRIDQRAIDTFLETGISVCDWPRPKE